MVEAWMLFAALFLAAFLFGMAAVIDSNACHKRAEIQRKMLDRKRAKPRSNPTSE